ncbi:MULTISPECIES: 4-hydroxythreonine-4-phosphate dehydrogenase PdxA [unclassified Leptolyngbya]|uniref:4-hydroxythreonine-4-phosphate dehydrogenase PdxA n=1 Tax=unclassified Leptolyngbya TaxID=2650499 RepID=UPI0016858B91|nr:MULTISPECIES: 4-hydroxythreonine-4-phosphate dehydrogenase PdxA [unclassified Leptolyngbya]MBD1911536.1 4-hydroxythreonine-4-phosphate dehydrogenase PdxA [Leptolyngbya sp. FACHB-8]MBD2155570.1 4-hydroxythreonine-4-phosphate dehydrogenase PdxA [Leptolyngbya sp. FACHB-16]
MDSLIHPGFVANPFNNGRPKLAIATGDPAGIGPEVVLKALADPIFRQNFDLTLVGNAGLLQHTYEQLRDILPADAVADPCELNYLDVSLESALIQDVEVGRGNAASGEASFRALEVAIANTLQGHFQGIVTAPIAKSAWKAAGHHYPGQTELLAEKAGVERFGMMFVGRSPHTGWTLRALLATTHIPLRQVPEALHPDGLTRKLDLLVQTLQLDFGLPTPRIAVAGLNPHSGEEGQLGHEEQKWLIPWIREMSDRYPQIQLDGPIPPDTLWVKPGQAWFGHGDVQTHDAYLALYHDQGLIPVKLMAFDRAVNTTIGLPFIRTSPDHGTAFDIAGRGIADPSSLKASIHLAAELVQARCQKYLSQGVQAKPH